MIEKEKLAYGSIRISLREFEDNPELVPRRAPEPAIKQVLELFGLRAGEHYVIRRREEYAAIEIVNFIHSEKIEVVKPSGKEN